MLDRAQISLECLRLACSDSSADIDKHILERASAYADFVMSKSRPPKPVPESKTDPHNPNIPAHGVTGKAWAG